MRRWPNRVTRRLQGILPQVGDYMLKKAEEWGADLRYETPFVQLAQDENGKVTGA